MAAIFCICEIVITGVIVHLFSDGKSGPEIKIAHQIDMMINICNSVKIEPVHL